MRLEPLERGGVPVGQWDGLSKRSLDRRVVIIDANIEHEIFGMVRERNSRIWLASGKTLAIGTGQTSPM